MPEKANHRRLLDASGGDSDQQKELHLPCWLLKVYRIYPNLGIVVVLVALIGAISTQIWVIVAALVRRACLRRISPRSALMLVAPASKIVCSHIPTVGLVVGVGGVK